MDPYIWHELVLSSKYPVSSVAVLGGGWVQSVHSAQVPALHRCTSENCHISDCVQLRRLPVSQNILFVAPTSPPSPAAAHLENFLGSAGRDGAAGGLNRFSPL